MYHASVLITPIQIKIAILIVCHLFTSPTILAEVELDVEIDGITGRLRANAMSSLSIQNQKDLVHISMKQIKRLHRKAPDEIKKAIQPFGYYRVLIDSDMIETDEGWLARYTVDKGPSVKINTLDIKLEGEGNEDAQFFNFVNSFPLNINDRLDHQQYETTKATFLEIATERGYLDAAFTQNKVIVDLDNYTATVILHFKSGQRYRFGNIEFQQSILNENFLQSFSPFEPGDPYVVSDLLALQQTLSNSHYFVQAEVRAMDNLAHNLTVPINVELKPHKPTRWTFGIGYGTDDGDGVGVDGFRTSAGWENRRINRKGHRIKTKAKFSKTQEDQTIQYLIPMGYYRQEQFAITGSRVHEFEQDPIKQPDNIVNKLAISRSTLRTNHWRETIGLAYQYDIVKKQTGIEYLNFLVPSISWLRIHADNQIYVQQGNRISFNIRGASNKLLSDTTFTQFETQGKLVHSINNKTRFISRAHGAISIAADFSEIAVIRGFRTGGDQSIRGYKFENLPEEGEGRKHILTGSIELEHTFIGKWSSAIFFDAGNAFDDIDDFEIKQSIGIGIRWLSPLGLIRLDAASPAENITLHNTRLHLVVGPDL